MASKWLPFSTTRLFSPYEFFEIIKRPSSARWSPDIFNHPLFVSLVLPNFTNFPSSIHFAIHASTRIYRESFNNLVRGCATRMYAVCTPQINPSFRNGLKVRRCLSSRGRLAIAKTLQPASSCHTCLVLQAAADTITDLGGDTRIRC